MLGVIRPSPATHSSHIPAKIRKVYKQVINLFRSIKANLIKTAEEGPYATFKWIDSFLFDFLLLYTLYELYLIDIHFIVQYTIASPL